MLSRLRTIRQALGWAGLVFAVLLAAELVGETLGLTRGVGPLRISVYLAGVWLVLRLVRR